MPAWPSPAHMQLANPVINYYVPIFVLLHHCQMVRPQSAGNLVIHDLEVDLMRSVMIFVIPPGDLPAQQEQFFGTAFPK